MSFPWAVAGWGVGGSVFHAPMIESAPGLSLAVVVSTNPARSEQARQRGYPVLPEFRDLVAAGIVGVTIATPAGTHAQLAHEALDVGLHVVVDKPFALTGSEAEKIITHAEQVGRMLTVYQNRRWDGDFLTVSDLVASGEIGRVDRFISRVERFKPDLPDWMSQLTSLQGGGTLVDLGPHLIDQAVQLLGPADAVFAQLSTFGAGRSSEDDVTLLMKHKGGAQSQIVASVHAAVEAPRFQVLGSAGGVLIEGFDAQEDQLLRGQSPASLGDAWGAEPASRMATIRTESGFSSRPIHRGRWDTFYPTLVEALQGNGLVPVDPQDSAHVARIFDAARCSSRDGTWVSVH